MLATIRPFVLAIACMLALATSITAAQSTPSLTVQATSDPLVWQVDGEGFAPGIILRVSAVSCGSLPCGAGSYGSVGATPDSSGHFSVLLDLSAHLASIDKPVVVTAYPTDRAGQADDPLVTIPFDFTTYTPVAASPTPGTPNVGNSLAPGGGAGAPALVAIFGALGILGLGMAARARRTTNL